MVALTALNGKIPSSLLVLIERGQGLRTDAAASWHRMEADGMPRGCLRSGYRDLAKQAALVRSGATVARAGTSFHGEGLAADVDEPARAWIRAHGAAYGWAKDHVPGEPWHFEYDPAQDQHANPGDDMTVEFERDVRAELTRQSNRDDSFIRDVRADLSIKGGQIATLQAAVQRIAVGGVDLAALAKAVNDDAARRLAT